MILVPRDTFGVTAPRGMEVFGCDDRDHGGHAEVTFSDVRVPAENLIGGRATASRSRGPASTRGGSTTACARSASPSGPSRRCARAEARVRIEQLRLLVLKAAWPMDTRGNKAAHSEIQAIKIATPVTVEWILDKAIQVHGAAVPGLPARRRVGSTPPGQRRCAVR